MNLILVLSLFIYMDIAIFISVYVYCRIVRETRTVTDDVRANKIKNSILFKAMLVGIFFPVTLPALAAVLIAARRGGM